MKKKKHLVAMSFLLVLLHAGPVTFAGTPKLFIATNKENYAAGEAIQFQVFLLSPSVNTNYSVFVELLDCKGNKLSKKMMPFILNNSGGNIELPDPAKADFYILYCYVINNEKVESDCTKKIFIQGKSREETNSAANRSSMQVAFEGNTFVAELSNTILIQTIDADGNPVITSGKIIDDKNAVITRFETDGRGYAKMSITPEAKVNYAIVAVDKKGREMRQALPQPSPRGVTLNVAVNDTLIDFKVMSYNGDEDILDYRTDVFYDSKLVYKADINFKAGLSFVNGELNGNDFPEGFLTFRVVDKSNNIIAQRIVYNALPGNKIHLLKIVDTVSKRESTIALPGYLSGNGYLKIAVNNNGLVEGALKNIPNTEQLVLENNSDKEISADDLLIPARSVNTFNNTVNENINRFLVVSGTLYSSDNKILKNKKLTLIILHRNLKKDFLVAATDHQGRFEIKNLVFYDSVTIYYQLADKSEDKNNVRLELRVSPSFATGGNELPAINFACAANIHKMEIDFSEKTLEAVTVKGEKEKTASEKFEEKYVSGQHNQKNSLRSEYDFIKDPPVIDNMPLFEFLKGRMGLIIQLSASGELIINAITGDGIGIYLNDMEMDATDLSSVSYLQVNETALVKYYSQQIKPRRTSTKSIYHSPFQGGDLMIYTKRDFISADPKVKGLPKNVIKGYDIETPYFNTASSSDMKEGCLYWQSNWSAEKYPTIYMALPPQNPATALQLYIEGINALMIPYRFTTNLIFK